MIFGNHYTIIQRLITPETCLRLFRERNGKSVLECSDGRGQLSVEVPSQPIDFVGSSRCAVTSLEVTWRLAEDVCRCGFNTRGCGKGSERFASARASVPACQRGI